MSTGTTLYYPFIHPRNSDHLKAALLYWDVVRRIVPESIAHELHDNKDCAMLAADGLLVSTKPEKYAEAATKRFFEFVEPRARDFTVDLPSAQELERTGEGIHVEKLGVGVIPRLRQLGVGYQLGEWVAMPREVGAFYMHCLASEIADQMKTPLFTDSPTEAALGQSLLFSPTRDIDSSEVLVRLEIEWPSPEALHDVPMKAIVKFAKDRSDERKRFREAIEGILQAVRSNTDSNATEDYLVSERKRIEKAVGDLRKTLNELKVGGGIGATIKLTVPAGAAAVIAALHLTAAAATILTATAVAVAAISCFNETRGKLRTARSSGPLAPYHYLVSLKKDRAIRKGMKRTQRRNK